MKPRGQEFNNYPEASRAWEAAPLSRRRSGRGGAGKRRDGYGDRRPLGAALEVELRAGGLTQRDAH